LGTIAFVPLAFHPLVASVVLTATGLIHKSKIKIISCNTLHFLQRK